MTFNEITNPKKYVRVVDSTYSPTDETRKMIGEDLEVKSEDYASGLVSVWDKNRSYYWAFNRSDYWAFNRSDVQFLTPVEFKGRKIAIGDEVEFGGDWFRVYGYVWKDGEWKVTAVQNNDFDYCCYSFSESEISDVRFPIKKIKEVTMSEVYEKFGEEVKIIK